jgi:hypothetical protein
VTRDAGVEEVVAEARERKAPEEEQVQLALSHLESHLKGKKRAVKTLRKSNKLNDTVLIQAMERYFEEHGIYN